MAYQAPGRKNTWVTRILAALFLLLLSMPCFAQPGKTTPADTSKRNAAVTPGDTTRPDSLRAQRTDTMNLKISQSAVESPVKYHARDSIVFDLIAKKAYLYDSAHIDYGTIQLDADSMNMDFTRSEIFAKGRPDSTGKIVGSPVFKDKDQVLNTNELGYNFKTKRGIVFGAVSKVGEGQIRGEVSKFVTVNDTQQVVYTKSARYSTCDAPHQHFYIATEKAKVIPNDKVITGPAYLVVEDVKLPLVLPFGFFPANSRKTSGIIVPQIGEAGERGFFVKNGGYYYGGNPYIDLALTGDFYTNGTTRIGMSTRYTNRYKFNGQFSFNYARNVNGLADAPGYTEEDNFSVNWVHGLDPKASPGTTFRSEVNITSPGYYRNNSVIVQNQVNQKLVSSISYSKLFTGTPFSIAAALRQEQYLKTGDMNMTLPSFTATMIRVYPFKSRTAIGHRWFHDIGVTSQLDGTNLLRSNSATLQEDLGKMKFDNGLHHSVPITTNFKIFDYFSFTPNIVYDGYYYSNKYIRGYNSVSQDVDTVLRGGFFSAHAYSVYTDLATNIYGTFRFRGERIKAIRHQLIPRISFRYKPDFSDPKYGYYGKAVLDKSGFESRYPYFENPSGIGFPAQGKFGSVDLFIQNLVQMKVRNGNRADTASPDKKVPILEAFDIRTSYNFLADSMQLSPVFLAARTTILERFQLQGNATLDPYFYGPQGRATKEYLWNLGQGIGRIRSANMIFAGSVNRKALPDARRIQHWNNPYIDLYYIEPYANFDIPWNVNFSYQINYILAPIRLAENQYTYRDSFTQTIGVTGELNITKLWKVTFNTNYDFSGKKFQATRISIYRDLHCWQMSFDWSPVGPYKYYLFNIHIKAPTLQDLKFEKPEYYGFDR